MTVLAKAAGARPNQFPKRGADFRHCPASGELSLGCGFGYSDKVLQILVSLPVLFVDGCHLAGAALLNELGYASRQARGQVQVQDLFRSGEDGRTTVSGVGVAGPRRVK